MRIRSIALLLGLGATPSLALTAHAQYDVSVPQPSGSAGSGEPFAINASRPNVGYTITAPLPIDPVMWSPSGTVLQDAGGGGGSGALAINVERGGFEVSFAPGSRDAAGHFMGGTEVRSLVAHAGKLLRATAIGRMTRSEGLRAPRFFVLDRPGGQWRVDHAFDERMPSGRARNLAIAAMGEVNFATDANGKPLAKPVSILLASTWDLTGEVEIFARDDATGEWTGATLALR